MATNPIDMNGGHFRKKWPNFRAAFNAITPLPRKGISAKAIFNIERRYSKPRDIIQAPWHLHAIADEIQGQLKGMHLTEPRDQILYAWHVISSKSEGFGFERDTKQRLVTSALMNKKLNNLTLSLLTLYLAKHFNWPVSLVDSPKQYFLKWKDNKNDFNFLGFSTFNDKDIINTLNISPVSIKNGVYLCGKSSEGELAAIHLNCAMVLLSENNRKGAFEELKIAAKLDPKNPHILLGLGIISREINELVDAEEYLTHALKLDPKFSSAYWERMRVHLLNGETEAMETDRLKSLLHGKYDIDHMDKYYWFGNNIVDPQKTRSVIKYDGSQMGSLYEFSDN